MSKRSEMHSATFDEGPWRFTVHVDTSAGIVRCVGLDVRGFRGQPGDAEDPPRPVSGGQLRRIKATDLRALSVPGLLARACDELQLGAEPGASKDGLERLRATFDRPGLLYNLAHYEEVAEVYSKNERHRPTKAVADRFDLSRSAAKKHVETCRELGLLGPTRPGMAGGGRRRFAEEDAVTVAESEIVTKVDRAPDPPGPLT